MVAIYLSALMMKYVLGYDGEFTWEACLLYGSIISATDPVAVVALLKELGASRRLATLIEGESLLNDGTAMVVFLVILDVAEGNTVSIGDVFIKFIRLSVGGPLLGIFAAMILSAILRRTHNNGVLEVNATIFTSYILFFVAESTTVHVSGILAIVTLGLYMTNTGKTRISTESEHSVHNVWSYIGFVAETIIFILAGIIMGQRSTGDSGLTYQDYLKLIPCYISLNIIRFVCILMFWPILKRIGYGLNFKQIVLCSYAGLRGAVGMSLALIVATSDKIPKMIQDIILLHVLGIALLTLLINATTTGALVRYLGLSKQSAIKKSILAGLTTQLEKSVDKNIEHLRENRHFNNVDWVLLKNVVDLTDLKNKFKKYKDLDLNFAGFEEQSVVGLD